MGLKLYLQKTKEIDKETDNIYLLYSNNKYIIVRFLSLSNKYGWGRFAFMVNAGTGANKKFRVVEHILLENIQDQAYGYFGLQWIGNANQVIPNPLTVSDLTQLSGGNAIEIQKFYDRVRSDMISKAI